jgi:hypothetical protein
MTAFVVDANAAVVASGRTPQADLGCVEACVNALAGITQTGMVVLDDEGLILSEYMDNLSISGQPGVGDAFMKWLWENQAVTARCEQVHLAHRDDDRDAFAAFPSDPRLGSFHRDDRKYVAAALTSQHSPTVLNAVDTDWWTHRAALSDNGISLRFLCPQHMR